MTETSETESRWVVLAPRYAHRFAAGTVSYEPPKWVEPTDKAFAECFRLCVWVPPVGAYPLIREVFFAEYGALRNGLTEES